MTNLLKETLEAIEQSGHAVADVAFIGSARGDYACTWAEFETMADREYDSGFGAQEVATDLVIRFTDDRHMWRHEYDGSENWDFDFPAQAWEGDAQPITKLIGGMSCPLSELNPVEVTK